MAFSIVRQDSANLGAGAGPFNFVLGAAPSSGDIITLGVDLLSLTIDPAATVTQTGVTWTKVQWATGTSSNTTWYGVAGPGASATIVITPASTTGAASVFAAASTWSTGGATVTLLAGQTSATTGTSTTPTTPNATPVTGHDSLVIGLMRRGSAYVSGPSNGFTDLTTGSSIFRMAYLITSAGGTVNTAWTFNSSAAWDTQTFVLDAGAPASGVAFNPLGGKSPLTGYVR